MNFSDIPADIEIFGSGTCPDKYFLSDKKPYITIQGVSRWSEYSPKMYSKEGSFGYKAWLHTFDKEGEEHSQFIDTFKDFPEAVMQRLDERGYCAFK